MACETEYQRRLPMNARDELTHDNSQSRRGDRKTDRPSCAQDARYTCLYGSAVIARTGEHRMPGKVKLR